MWVINLKVISLVAVFRFNGDQLIDLDMTVVNGAGRLQGVDQFGKVGLAGRPGRVRKREQLLPHLKSNARVQPQQFVSRKSRNFSLAIILDSL